MQWNSISYFQCQCLSILVLITKVSELALVQNVSSKNISAFSPNLQKQTSKQKKNLLSILKGFRVTTMFPQFQQYEILRPTFSLVKQIGNYLSLFDVVNTGTNWWKHLVSWRSLCQLKNVMERNNLLSVSGLIAPSFDKNSIRNGISAGYF